MGRLLFFMGTECDHCHEMEPLVQKLEQELKIKVKRLEVWHDSKNQQLFEKIDQGKCGGVPLFFNEDTKKTICGATSYEKLKAWATGK